MPLVSLHCSKCGTEGALQRVSEGSYEYTCVTCGQVSTYTIPTPDDTPSCNCPICTKHFHDLSFGIGVDFTNSLLAYFAVVV